MLVIILFFKMYKKSENPFSLKEFGIKTFYEPSLPGLNIEWYTLASFRTLIFACIYLIYIEVLNLRQCKLNINGFLLSKLDIKSFLLINLTTFIDAITFCLVAMCSLLGIKKTKVFLSKVFDVVLFHRSLNFLVVTLILVMESMVNTTLDDNFYNTIMTTILCEFLFGIYTYFFIFHTESTHIDKVYILGLKQKTLLTFTIKVITFLGAFGALLALIDKKYMTGIVDFFTNQLKIFLTPKLIKQQEMIIISIYIIMYIIIFELITELLDYCISILLENEINRKLKNSPHSGD